MDANELRHRRAETGLRERIGHLAQAIDKLAQAVNVALQSERGVDRASAEKLLDEVGQLTATAMWEL